MSLRTLWAVALLVFAGAVQAAPQADARAHFAAVAKGDVTTVMSQYADSAVLQWVGGPLDGAYSGAVAIRGVWTKFATANTPAKVKVRRLQTDANPSGATVTADVVFHHKKSVIKVRYILTYRAGKLVNEVWQVSPHLKM